MATAIHIEVLPARHGDCIIVECPREQGPSWRMLIDGGPPDCWPALQLRLSQLPADDRRFDVAVISHIDSDHIGGMIPFLHSPFAAAVADFWFNGRIHLPGPGVRSVRQGESVVAGLLGEASGRVLPWNQAFGGAAIQTGDEGGFLEVPFSDGPCVTVLSPTWKRLESLGYKWFESIESARRGAAGPDATSQPLDALTDLEIQAADPAPRDDGAPNGSSIALLIEHRGASAVLGADAFGNVLGVGLAGVARARDLDHLAVDAFKLPHHGSKRNVLNALLKVGPGTALSDLQQRRHIRSPG